MKHLITATTLTLLAMASGHVLAQTMARPMAPQPSPASAYPVAPAPGLFDALGQKAGAEIAEVATRNREHRRIADAGHGAWRDQPEAAFAALPADLPVAQRPFVQGRAALQWGETCVAGEGDAAAEITNAMPSAADAIRSDWDRSVSLMGFAISVSPVGRGSSDTRSKSQLLAEFGHHRPEGTLEPFGSYPRRLRTATTVGRC